MSFVYYDSYYTSLDNALTDKQMIKWLGTTESDFYQKFRGNEVTWAEFPGHGRIWKIYKGKLPNEYFNRDGTRKTEWLATPVDSYIPCSNCGGDVVVNERGEKCPSCGYERKAMRKAKENRRTRCAQSNKITARTWNDLIVQLSEMGYNVSEPARSIPSSWIYAFKGTDEYEIEVTRYFDGEYEIMLNNINKIARRNKKASSGEIEVNVTGEYCDGYAYIDQYSSTDDYNCNLDLECWGPAGEDAIDCYFSIPGGYTAQAVALSIIDQAEFEYGDELGIDENELAAQLEVYGIGKIARRARRNKRAERYESFTFEGWDNDGNGDDKLSFEAEFTYVEGIYEPWSCAVSGDSYFGFGAGDDPYDAFMEACLDANITPSDPGEDEAARIASKRVAWSQPFPLSNVVTVSRKMNSLGNYEYGYEIGWGSLGTVPVEDAREFAEYILECCNAPERYVTASRHARRNKKADSGWEKVKDYLWERNYSNGKKGHIRHTDSDTHYFWFIVEEPVDGYADSLEEAQAACDAAVSAHGLTARRNKSAKRTKRADAAIQERLTELLGEYMLELDSYEIDQYGWILQDFVDWLGDKNATDIMYRSSANLNDIFDLNSRWSSKKGKKMAKRTKMAKVSRRTKRAADLDYAVDNAVQSAENVITYLSYLPSEYLDERYELEDMARELAEKIEGLRTKTARRTRGRVAYIDDMREWDAYGDGLFYEGYDFNAKVKPDGNDWRAEVYYSDFGGPEYTSVMTQGGFMESEDAIMGCADMVDDLFDKGIIKGGSRNKLAYEAQEMAQDIKSYLDSEGTFDSEDAVRDFIYEEIDNKMIYSDDIWDTFQRYVEDRKLFEQFYQEYDEFVDDVLNNIGDLSVYVQDDAYEASKRQAQAFPPPAGFKKVPGYEYYEGKDSEGNEVCFDMPVDGFPMYSVYLIDDEGFVTFQESFDNYFDAVDVIAQEPWLR